jgi:DNA replication and repair protein RecF
VWITQLDIVGWRNHQRSSLAFDRGVNILVGANGQGKTNIVEAIRYLSTLSSHRVSGATALIGDGEHSATVFASLRHSERDVSVGITLKRQGASDATVSGNSAKVTEVPRWVSAVMFSPEDAAIVRGEPGFRRQFLDELVVSGSPVMAGVYQDFEKVLKQRNTLLKSLRTQSRANDAPTLDVWNASFVALGATIVSERRRHIQAILPHVEAAYSDLAQGTEVAALYVPKGYDLATGDCSREEIERALGEALVENLPAERERGTSLIGPQRDDVDLSIQGRPARTHASQGETWSLALALRLGTAAWLREEKPSGDPIIILDDVFAELDSTRRSRLVGLITDYEQLLLTSAVESDIPAELSGTIFDVVDGHVSKR